MSAHAYTYVSHSIYINSHSSPLFSRKKEDISRVEDVRFPLPALANQKREETSELKILRIKKREYRDGIKSRETRPGWGEAHNVYKPCVGTTEGF